MRILYFSYVELDIPNACRTHTLGIINGFARHGCRVDALIPKPKKYLANVPNVRFILLRPWQFSLIGSIWIRLVSAIVMLWLCLRNRYDFIYIRELEINPGPRWCARLFKLPLYIEINDLLVPTYSSLGMKKWLIKRVSENQKQDFRLAAGLIVPSVPMRRWIIKHYKLSHQKVHFVPNGVEVPYKKPSKKIDARKRLKIPLDHFCIGFVGNIYERYDFETLLKALDICRSKKRKIFLLVIGDGPLKVSLQEKVAEYDMNSCSLFTGYVDPELLGNYVTAIDAGVIIFNREIAKRYGPLNTKSATYGIFNVAVIVSCIASKGYPKELVNPLFLNEPESPQALADLIMCLQDDPREREKKANMFHLLIKSKLTWEACTNQILHIVKKETFIKSGLFKGEASVSRSVRFSLNRIGTKIDNVENIAHNAVIGENCLLGEFNNKGRDI